MTDNLRDRIAKAIAGAVYGHNTLETAWADLHEDAQDEYFAEADAVIEALDDMGIIHLSKVRPSYADNFCRGGCDCSCCYGMADEPCHCRDAVCNCGGDRAAHGQKPLEDK